MGTPRKARRSHRAGMVDGRRPWLGAERGVGLPVSCAAAKPLPSSHLMSREEALFAEALALPASERPALLDQRCAADAALRVQVEGLLAGYDVMERAGAPAFVSGLIVGPEEKPGDPLGRYRLVEKIGEGGWGVVWRAEQGEPVRRAVALKIIKLGMDTKEVIARFEAERQALARMEHPNIAKVFDAGVSNNGRPFFVMELVPGVAIKRY